MTNHPESPASDPKNSRYWDSVDLIEEERRQFQVCDGCRLCWNLCSVFPELFTRSDSTDNDVSQLASSDFSDLNDLCFQCKLCWVVCPYTEPHEFQLDIPRLLERANFVRNQGTRTGIGKKLIANQDLIAKLAGGRLARLTNLANRVRISRKLIEVVVGIHRDAILPEYHSETFTRWFRKHYGDALNPSGAERKVAFFPSCTVDNNDPEIGKACIRVLEHNNVSVVVPEHQCCGMPFVDAGDYGAATRKMDFNVKQLAALVDEGYDIVVPQPTCTLVLREDYPSRSEIQAAERVAAHTFEFGHYLTMLAREGQLVRNFTRGLGTVGFHVACHTRRQAAGINSPRLLRIIPDTAVETVEQCSGHDGSWGISRKYFPLSLKIGKKLFENFNGTSPDVLISDCPLAARHIQLGTGRRPIHTAQALALAYGISMDPAGLD